MAVFVVAFLALFLQHALSQQNQILLNGDAALVVSDADRFNNTAFNLTLKDFIIDFYNAFGIAPLLQDTTYTPCSASFSSSSMDAISVIYLGTFENNAYAISLLPNQDTSSCTNGTESHCVMVVYDRKYSVYSLIAMANDTRGTIYAAYSVSELLFNVDPLYRFTGINGAFYPNGIVLNKSLSIKFPSPLFEYRALFNNDEDLLGDAFADPLGMAVHSATAYNWLFESTLRMKGNMMIVGTIPYPDEISIRLASKRGLIVTDHHFDLLGINTFAFPSSINNEWLWQTTPSSSVPAFAWKSSMNALYENTNGEVVFSVGYRGLNDYPGPCENCTEQQNGMVISQVIGNMTEWIDKQYGTKTNKITYLWSEGIEYFADGYLTIPDQVSIILTDNGNGIIEDTDQYANVSEGIYTHTAMYNGGANQLTEMVSPFRHFSEIGKFASKSKKNKYAIINTSDLKPCILSTAAVFCYLYHGENCAQGDARQFMLSWCEKHYLFESGTDSNYAQSVTQQIEQLYERYYNISYVQQGLSDNYIANQIYDISNAYLQDVRQNNGQIDDNTVNAIKSKMQSNATFVYVEQLFMDAVNLLDKISSNLTEESRHLYTSHILLQFAYHFFGQSVINNVYYSALNLKNGNQQIAVNYLETALNSNMQEIFRYSRMSEIGVWRGLYYGARLSDFQRARTMLRALYQLISSMDMSGCLLPIRPFEYYSFTWYQLPHHANYPYFHYNARVHLSTFPRIFCLNTGNEINNMNVSNCCINNADGGIFWANNQERGCGEQGAYVKINVIDWSACRCIRYTTDGSMPNENTPTFVVDNEWMINVTQTTLLRASCQYYNSSMDPQVSDAYFELQA